MGFGSEEGFGKHVAGFGAPRMTQNQPRIEFAAIGSVLLVEQGDAGGGTLVPEIADPSRVHDAGTWAAFTTADDPVGLGTVAQVQRTERGLVGDEPAHHVCSRR